MNNGKPPKSKRVGFTLETKEPYWSNITNAGSVGPTHGCPDWASDSKQSDPGVLCRRMDSLGLVGVGDWKCNTGAQSLRPREIRYGMCGRQKRAWVSSKENQNLIGKRQGEGATRLAWVVRKVNSGQISHNLPHQSTTGWNTRYVPGTILEAKSGKNLKRAGKHAPQSDAQGRFQKRLEWVRGAGVGATLSVSPPSCSVSFWQWNNKRGVQTPAGFPSGNEGADAVGWWRPTGTELYQKDARPPLSSSLFRKHVASRTFFSALRMGPGLKYRTLTLGWTWGTALPFPIIRRPHGRFAGMPLQAQHFLSHVHSLLLEAKPGLSTPSCMDFAAQRLRCTCSGRKPDSGGRGTSLLGSPVLGRWKANWANSTPTSRESGRLVTSISVFKGTFRKLPFQHNPSPELLPWFPAWPFPVLKGLQKKWILTAQKQHAIIYSKFRIDGVPSIFIF